MKEKIKVLAPKILLKTLGADAEFFGMKRERLCNAILLKFSEKSILNFQHDLLYDEKEPLQFNLNMENRRYYPELMKNFGICNESEVIRSIFINYAVLCPQIREMYLFREKINFILEAMNSGKKLELDTTDGVVRGIVKKVSGCENCGYLKMTVNGCEYYISQTRIIK